MNIVFRHPRQYLAAHWLVTVALAIGLFIPWHDTLGSRSSVTLITGQTVTLDRLGAPLPERGMSNFAVSASDNYAIPDPLVRSTGVFFDPHLFDVTYLELSGFGDDRSSATPVLVSFASMTDARRAFAQGTVDGGIRLTHLFEYLPMAAGIVAKHEIVATSAIASSPLNDQGEYQIGQVLTNDTMPSGTGPADGAGVTGVYLDSPVPLSNPDLAVPLLDTALPIIGADVARSRGLNGTGINIAVIDTGIDATHPDLQGRVIVAKNFSTDRDTLDHFGHGTHVASIAAGTGAASDGKYGGVAPRASLINAKALSSQGSGTTNGIMQAMEWSADQGAKVINMSLGGDQSDGTDPMSREVNAISRAKNVLFVIAAGNSGPRRKVSTPAAADLSLAVGAIDKDRELAPFSSRGPRLSDMALKPDIVAPGVMITAARANYGSGNPYVTYSGTSMATPMTAGAAALVWQMHPAWNGQQVKDALMSAASPIGAACEVTPFDQGAGVVNLARIVDQSVVLSPAGAGLGIVKNGSASVTIALKNISSGPIALNLTTSLCPSSGSASGRLEITPPQLSVNADATAQVKLTVSDFKSSGTFAGSIIVRRDGAIVAQSPIGFVVK